MASEPISRSDFPRRFVFGVGTSAYQTEGATHEDGRTDCIWDVYAKIPNNIVDGSTADIAADHYHRYEEDINLMHQLGFNVYRFSISWSRIFPERNATRPNEKGICHYKKVIKAIRDKGMEPYVTLYHWDLPNYLQVSKRGWLCSTIVDDFGKYAETCFENFGNSVQHWVTFNEPINTAVNGYGTGMHAPGRTQDPLHEPYMAAHNIILSHAKAVSIYKEHFQASQGGKISMSLNCEWAEPYSKDPNDVNAAKRHLSFQLGWFLDPIFYGDYPKDMRDKLKDRLPPFQDADKKLLTKYPMDFIGINNYTARYIANDEDSTDPNFFIRDQQIERLVKNSEGEDIGEKAASDWLYIVPWGMKKLLSYVSEKYDNPPIFVTENGMDEDDDPNAKYPNWIDDNRTDFYEKYLKAVSDSIKDGVDVRGFFAWSFLDNWEWTHGFTKRFGLVYLDRKNGLIRYPKFSASWFYSFLNGKMPLSVFRRQFAVLPSSDDFTDLQAWDRKVKEFMNLDNLEDENEDKDEDEE